MNIFAGLQVYAGKWNVVDSRGFNAEELSMIQSFLQEVCHHRDDTPFGQMAQILIGTSFLICK